MIRFARRDTIVRGFVVVLSLAELSSARAQTKAMSELRAAAGGDFALVADGSVSPDESAGVEVIGEKKGVLLSVQKLPDETIMTYADRQTVMITDRNQFRAETEKKGEGIGQLLGAGIGLFSALRLRDFLVPNTSGLVSLLGAYAMITIGVATVGSLVGGWLAGKIADATPDEFTRDVNARSVVTRE